jgi:signal transduction histidine kinase
MSEVRNTSQLPGSLTLPNAVAGQEQTLAMARARWLEVHDELLRGITHALSNRIATISAAAYMLEHEDVTCQQAAESLRLETERMDALLQLLRLLPSRDDTGFEPVAPRDIVEDAVALHAHHCDLRDVVIDVQTDPDVLPVWVEPHALMQSLLLALTAAKRAAFPNMLGVTLHIGGDSDTIRISVYPDGGASVDAPRTAIDAAAGDSCVQSAHGRMTPRADGGCEITLPSLPAVRRAGR